MIQTALADLDELMLRCRDDRARAYIAEAVACYRGGAYRAAIVAAWVAVCFDIIDKLRELALAGDKEADNVITDIEKARQTNDITRALRIERELLPLARDKFELLSHVEYVDLERLQQDRNRCAHPSLVSDEQPFTPSGELARLHIYSAVTHLLQHPPVQGKYALERLLREVASDYFPDDVKKATASLSSGPLIRPRESLVRNLVIVLMKQLLEKDLQWKKYRRAKAALGAVKALHGAYFETTLKDKLPALIRAVDDAELHLVTRALCIFPECWAMLAADLQNRLESYVVALPSEHLETLDELLEYEPLKEHAERRAKMVTRKELKDMAFFILPNALIERAIDLYMSSRNFAEANDFAKTLAPYIVDFSASQQERLLKGVAANGEVLHSFELGTVISSLRNTKAIPLEQFDALLEDNGLENFVLTEEKD